MLILRGSSGKSRIIDILMSQTNSVCFVYNDYPLIDESIGVDSTQYTIEGLLACISHTMKDYIVNDKHYDYCLIYTNQKEEDLQKLTDWLNRYKWEFPIRDIIVTCK